MLGSKLTRVSTPSGISYVCLRYPILKIILRRFKGKWLIKYCQYTNHLRLSVKHVWITCDVKIYSDHNTGYWRQERGTLITKTFVYWFILPGLVYQMKLRITYRNNVWCSISWHANWKFRRNLAALKVLAYQRVILSHQHSITGSSNFL